LKLLHEFNTLEELLDSIDKVGGKKLKEKLEEHKEQAIMSKKLATIHRDAPIEIGVSDLEYNGYDGDQVIKLFKELGFNSLLDKVEGSEQKEDKPLEEISFKIVDEITEEMLTDEASLIIEVLDESYHKADIQGISLSNMNGNYYIPTKLALESTSFMNWAKDKAKKKTVFDAKKSIVALKWMGIDLQGIEFDCLIAAYILNPSDSTNDIAAIAKGKGITDVQTDEAVYGKGAKQRIPDEPVLAEHLVRKAVSLAKLKDLFLQELKENEQYELFTDLEMPLSIILAEMESTGVKVDIERLKAMGEELKEHLQELEQRIYELAGEEFNINSPKQLGVILFEKLQLTVYKKTKTGYSTSADILEKLAKEHEIIEYILHYGQIVKLQSTYIEGLLKVVHEDTSKVHTRFQQALTQTGRLSSTDPNLQNIPIRLEEGRKIRQAFVPSQKDWYIFAADYSQIELRVLAH